MQVFILWKCYVCDQSNADENGSCWDVANSADQELQVCEKGCYSKFQQDRSVFEAEDHNVQTKIIRQCAGEFFVVVIWIVES